MVAKLTALDGPLKGLVLYLEKREEWILGRDPQNSHIVVEDPRVDRRQLILRFIDGQFSIENLSESVPLFVNDQQLTQPQILFSGDKIRIGSTLFEFQAAAHENRDSEPSSSDEEDLFVFGEAPSDEEESKHLADFSEEGNLFVEANDDQKWHSRNQEEGNGEEDFQLESLEKDEEPQEELETSEVLEENAEESELEASSTEEEHEYEFEAEDEPQRVESAAQEDVHVDDKDFEEKPLPNEESEHDEPIFNFPEEDEEEGLDLAPSVRFLLKVISGPNSGAEFALQEGEHYTIGTDTTSCDIVLHDLSVSREHAKLFLAEDGQLSIEDLDSRNGVLIDQQEVIDKTPFDPNSIVTLGTTSFFVLDREAPQETIIAPSFETVSKEEPEKVVEEPKLEEQKHSEEKEKRKKKIEELVATKKATSDGTNIFATMVIGLAVIIGLGILSLWNVKEVTPLPSDYLAEIQEAVQDFPGIKFTYSKVTRRLFLVGHVSTGVEKSELLYNLDSLPFLQGIEDNIVNDEAVWQEMNILLSKDEMFKGVSLYAPRPGAFMLQGYLKTEEQAAALHDYMNLHFNFIELLENHVVVEEQVKKKITAQLIQSGFGSVVVSFLNGDLVLAGYVGANQEKKFDQLMQEFRMIPGVRQLQNFVVIVSPEQEVIDLNLRFPGKYIITGFSKRGDVNINVVVNGKILSRGDTLDGMTLTSLQPGVIFLESDGLKYKLEYHK